MSGNQSHADRVKGPEPKVGRLACASQWGNRPPIRRDSSERRPLHFSGAI